MKKNAFFKPKTSRDFSRSKKKFQRNFRKLKKKFLKILFQEKSRGIEKTPKMEGLKNPRISEMAKNGQKGDKKPQKRVILGLFWVKKDKNTLFGLKK